MKWRNIMLLSLLCLSCAGLYAQENMKVNSIKREEILDFYKKLLKDLIENSRKK